MPRWTVSLLAPGAPAVGDVWEHALTHYRKLWDGAVWNWLREIVANDANPALAVTQSGAGGGLKVISPNDTDQLIVSNGSANLVRVKSIGGSADLGIGVYRDVYSFQHELTLYSPVNKDIILVPGSGGRIDLQRELYNSSANEGGYVAVGDILSVKDTFYLRLPTTTRPAASATYRNMLLVEQGGAGVADVIYACLKSALDAYSWVPVVTG